MLTVQAVNFLLNEYSKLQNFILDKPYGQEITHPVLSTVSQVMKGGGQTVTGKPGRGLYNIASGAAKLTGIPTTPLTVLKKGATALTDK